MTTRHAGRGLPANYVRRRDAEHLDVPYATCFLFRSAGLLKSQISDLRFASSPPPMIPRTDILPVVAQVPRPRILRREPRGFSALGAFPPAEIRPWNSAQYPDF
jgi:hypothetical protein